MSGVAWGLGLIGVTPIAKLVAIRIGDMSNTEGIGALASSELAEWCCCASSDEVFDALELLAKHSDVEWTVGSRGVVSYKLPDVARPALYKVQPRGTLPAQIYIFRGRLGLKIGITTKSLKARLDGMRAATLDDSISIEWSVEDRESVIRLSERLAHAKLAAKLIRNEWFDVSLEDAIAAVVAAIEEARKAQK